MKSLKWLAAFVLIVGGAAACFLTFGVAMSFLFYIFAPPPMLNRMVGYISLIGPLPLVAGAILLFFHRTERLGAKLALAGSGLLTIYMVLCLVRLDANAMGMVQRFLWFFLAPATMLAVDAAAFRIYKVVGLRSGTFVSESRSLHPGDENQETR